MDYRDSKETTHLEDRAVEHVSHEQHADTVYLNVQSARTMTGEFPNLSSLIAPKLSTLNAPEIDIKLVDFPQLREVRVPIKGWKRIREAMRVAGWHYQNGELVQLEAEKLKIMAAAKAGKYGGSFISGLVEIYGEGIRDLIKDIEENYPGITQEEIVREIEMGSTCEKPAFFKDGVYAVRHGKLEIK